MTGPQEELIFNPSLLPEIKKELWLDPFPPEVRQFLEKWVVRDIVNLVMEYARYSTLDYSRPSIDWDMIREAEYNPYIRLCYELDSTNLRYFLLCLRLAGTHVYLDRAVYAALEQLSKRRSWTYLVQDPQLISCYKLGEQICNWLLARRIKDPLEQFYRTFWGVRGEEGDPRLRLILRQSNVMLHTCLHRLNQAGDEAFRGIIQAFCRVHNQVEGWETDYPKRITTAYFTDLDKSCPYTKEEFLFYFSQLLDYYRSRPGPPVVRGATLWIPDQLTEADVFGG